MATASVTHENRLVHETSPYLLQHAHNPVDWYPWGEEALRRARELDRPILLSIGYAACHWCHVMERESFENDAIAALMNRHFVCIKVDREERPDIDAIYMNATVAMSGGGGWPMTVVLTPEQEPFFAGTYFPPEARYGRPGFRDLLRHIANLWETDREGAVRRAKQLTAALAAQAEPDVPANIAEGAIAVAVSQLAQSFDAVHGGFGRAPKFPPPAALSLLLRHHVRTGDPHALVMVTKTLDGMKNGGIYDHVGGGFARYSTDDRWLVPHFEKMLYDNAQLARVYLEALQVTKDPEYARVARETLEYVAREMQSDEGGYFSATDADSEGVEGKFFVFRPEDVAAILAPEEARRFCAYYDVTDAGNWEGTSILHTPRTHAEVAESLGIREDELRASLDASRPKVYAGRTRRVPPLLDDKILTSWNGLMIAAMAEGHRVLGEPRYLASAKRAADDLLTRMRRPDGGLFRTARAGRAHVEAFLEDYAFFADALVDLYEAGAERRYLEEAERLAERIRADFREERSGGFCKTAASGERLIVRPLEAHDGAIPSDVAVAARLFARLAHHLDRAEYRDVAGEALRAHGARMAGMPRAYCTALSVVDFLLEGPVEVVLTGKPGDSAYEALRGELARHPLPNRALAHVGPGERPAAAGLTSGRPYVPGKAVAYVCRRFVCKAPTSDPGALAELLGEAQRLAGQERATDLAAGKIAGRATPDGTAAVAAARGRAHGGRGYVAFGTTGLVASRLGFGGYRVTDGNPVHREALLTALRAGVNVVDTSTNYADGGSERLVGQAIAELRRAGEVAREGVIVVSKVGYAQRSALALARERKDAGFPFPEMLEIDDELWHCIHPAWIEDQLDRSLDRLGLETLDVLLLHNPEYFFQVESELELSARRDELYRRIEAAFAHLEAEVARGRIQFYGVSSNTIGYPDDEPGALDLARVVAAAERAGGAEHHFRVVELPMNLLEPEAMLVRNTGPKRERSALDEAAARSLAVLVNRPLNAVVGDELVRLASAPETDVVPDFERAHAAVEDLEREFRETIAGRLDVRGNVPATELFAWGERLRGVPERLRAGSDWKQTEHAVIRPEVAHRVRAVERASLTSPELAADFERFRDRYLQALDRLLRAIAGHAAGLQAEQAAAIEGRIDRALPPDLRGETLSRKALVALLSVPAVTTVLVGMREPAYVEDALGTMGRPALADPRAAFDALFTPTR